MKWALINKILFSIRKFVSFSVMKFSGGYMNFERKLSCFKLIRKLTWPIISRIRSG